MDLTAFAQPPSATSNPGAKFASIRELLDACVAEHAARAVFLAPGRDPMTFAGLRAECDRWASLLRDHNVDRGDRVVILAPEGADLATIVVGVAAVTAAVPLSPALTGPELEAAFDALQPTAAVLHIGIPAAVGQWVRESGTPVIEVASDPAVTGKCAPQRWDGFRGGDGRTPVGDVALILPTSGTTSRPRQVPITQRTLLAAAGATCVAYNLTPADRRLNAMPLVHVQGLVGCVVAALISGSSVVCLPRFDPHRFADALSTFEATWYSATPTMHAALLAAAAPATTPTLRFVRSGSGALSAELRDRLEARLMVPVVESYGMTEAHQVASSSLDSTDHRPGAVGRPTGSWVTIVDDRDRPVARGRSGAILIRGENVFGGYLAPEQEAFSGDWFRTGDLGSLDDDGFLTILGRSKELINRGGEKVAPLEVDRALLSHPGVAEAAAFGVPHEMLQEDVMAAVVLAEPRVAERELLEHARRQLTPHKTPRRILVLAELPRNAMGKVMRHQLSESFGGGTLNQEININNGSGARPDNEGGTRSSALQTAVLALWKEVLHLDHIGLDEDFFSLGGDSLTGALLLNMVEELFGVTANPMWMYDQANTVNSMTALIEKLRDQVRNGSATE